MNDPEATPPDVDAIAEAAAAGVAAGLELRRQKEHLALVQPVKRVPGSPALTDAFQAVDRIHGARGHELAGWRAYQAAARDRAIVAATKRAVGRAARIPLPYMPRFGEPGDPRPPIDVRVNACTIDDDARATWLATQGTRLTWWRRHVRLGTAERKRYRISYGEHNANADKGTYHARTVTILRGRREPTRAALSAGICAATAIGAGTAYGASWAIPRALSAITRAISPYVGTAMTVLLIIVGAAIVASWRR